MTDEIYHPPHYDGPVEVIDVETKKTSRAIDLTGQSFGFLTVLGKGDVEKSGAIRWACRCECGRITLVRGHRLRHGITRSCGKCGRVVPEDENWAWAKGYEGLYLVSSLGRVASVPRNNHRGGLRRTVIAKTGYEMVSLGLGDMKRTAYVHRLVAETFLQNPDNKREVNHIDGNKTNNRATNLEWVSSSENKLHAYAMGIRKPPTSTTRKPVLMDGERLYGSISEAAKDTGIDRVQITNVCHGRRRIAHGHKFEFVGNQG